MFDHDADKRRGAGLTAFNPLAEPKAMPEPRPLPSFERLERLERLLREEKVEKAYRPAFPTYLTYGATPEQITAYADAVDRCLSDIVGDAGATGQTRATGCLSSPEYPKGMNGPTGGAPPVGVGKRTQALLASGCLDIRKINREGLDWLLSDDPGKVTPPNG